MLYNPRVTTRSLSGYSPLLPDPIIHCLREGLPKASMTARWFLSFLRPILLLRVMYGSACLTSKCHVISQYAFRG